MSSSELEETERRLAEVEALRQSTQDLLAELTAYREALTKKRAWLRASAEVKPPVPRAEVRQYFERRIERRRIGNPVSIVIADPSAADEPCSAWVMDRSLTGLGVWADAAEPVGSVLTVRPAQAEDWWTRVIVKHCREERGNWVLGCQFVEAVPWKQLRLFG